MSEFTGTEEGWKDASNPSDPRHSMKQRDIRQTINKMMDNRKAAEARHQADMEADYYEGALDLAHSMLGDRSFGYSRKYSANYDNAFKEETK